jgi:hypothetical protein
MQQTATTEEFLNKAREFGYAMSQINVEELDAEDDMHILTNCVEFFKISFPEVLRLAQVGVTLSAR